jgi:UDP-N-acetylglucosamine--N-acetylmuramyl-(pentapeptide) pyrophosphoryl-undecaprenol N-acetylglucosamine transferase
MPLRSSVINAKKLVDLGAARMVLDQELTGEIMARTILHLYNHPEERDRMEEAIQRLGKPRAAEEIVDHCYALIGKGKNGSLSSLRLLG